MNSITIGSKDGKVTIFINQIKYMKLKENVLEVFFDKDNKVTIINKAEEVHDKIVSIKG
ncbi:hypothetical protein [Arcobacter sp. F2176]|uniref:hypothetical protein n=1 Tax=Arcobacter sp. F2176 TaxID=2044511 RepID=UPI0013E904FC|nr:hypothetical protein [Arcobacter sp. F2176]